MKKTTKKITPAILFITGFLFMSFYGCRKTNDNVGTVGYIVDYGMCDQCRVIPNENGDSASACLYYIITEDLKDTFAAFNLPDNPLRLPVEFFNNWPNNGSLYRYTYKIQFEYEEDFPKPCTDMGPSRFPYYFLSKSQYIKITSAKFLK